MVKRKGVSDSPCPVARALDVIGDRWTLLIIRDAFDDVRRFGAFQSSLGIARNILTDRLRSLEEAGILQAVPASDGSAYQDYVLTPRVNRYSRLSWRCASGERGICLRGVKRTRR